MYIANSIGITVCTFFVARKAITNGTFPEIFQSLTKIYFHKKSIHTENETAEDVGLNNINSLAFVRNTQQTASNQYHHHHEIIVVEPETNEPIENHM